jgi:glycosyltransferase involved in cell wall biosynthesis
MRLIHVLTGSANPNTVNGVNKVVHSLAEAQAAMGCAVEVWGISDDHLSDRVQRSYLPRRFERQRNPFLLDGNLTRSLDKLTCTDWVQLHSVFVPELVTVAKRLAKRGIPYGATPHGALGKTAFSQSYLRKQTFFRLFDQPRLRRAAMVQAISDEEFAALTQLVPEAKVTLIPNGCGEVKTGNESRRDTRHRPIFGYIGRMTICQKGLDFLLNGFSEYVYSGGAGTLWMVGGGADSVKLEHMAECAGIASRVVFHGTQYGAEKDRLLMNMDAFVHTSRWEGLPTACLEAAAAQRPLIVTRETGLKTYIERYRCGLVLMDAQPSTVARTLHEFSKNYTAGTAAEWGRRAAEMIKYELNWPRIAMLFEQEIRLRRAALSHAV